MKAYEVLNLLRVSRPTLTNYVKQKHQNYVGRRIKRGLFQGSNYILNADVNGALNILRKVVGDGFIQDLSDRGYWFQPVLIRDMFQTSHKQFLLKPVNNS